MASRDNARPNVIVILSDDQGYWAMGCAGNAEIRTPNLDRLASTGTRFTDLFCASPVCSPARASLLTGRIPSQHGVHDWIRAGNAPSDRGRDGALIDYLAGMAGYSDILAQQGYRCGLSGKWHLGDSVHVQKGFTFWEVHARGSGPYYAAPMIRDRQEYVARGYVTDVITDNGLAFLDTCAQDDQPFYLSLHYTAPHDPWTRENHPDELYDGYFNECSFESVPFVPMHPWQIRKVQPWGDREYRRHCLSGYFAAVTAMDRNIGRVLDWLDDRGLRENTLILFTSDNGMNMGHHGIYGKGNGTFPQNMFDTSVKVPGLISRPGHVPQGETCSDLLSHYDWMPTLLDYLGLRNPEGERSPGRSFAKLLRGEKGPVRENVVVFDEYGPVRMIRTREWKYVHRYPYGPHELYDLISDPDEGNDLYGDRRYQAQVIQMRSRLEKWFHRYVDPCLDGSKEAVSGKGQLGLVGPTARGRPRFGQDWVYEATGDQTRLPYRNRRDAERAKGDL